jgi:MinD-like ATPase involved in chromosome partitioning or flagellar assembly
VVLVVTPEVSALRSAARFLRLTDQLGYGPERMRVVANRANAGNDITAEVMARYLGRQVAAALPSEGPALVECLNAGRLVVNARPEIGVASGIVGLAGALARDFGWQAPAGATISPQSAHGVAARLARWLTPWRSSPTAAGAPAERPLPAMLTPTFGRPHLRPVLLGPAA